MSQVEMIVTINGIEMSIKNTDTQEKIKTVLFGEQRNTIQITKTIIEKKKKRKTVRTTKAMTRWTPEDDARLVELRTGGSKFKSIARELLRSAASCELRYWAVTHNKAAEYERPNN